MSVKSKPEQYLLIMFRITQPACWKVKRGCQHLVPLKHTLIGLICSCYAKLLGSKAKNIHNLRQAPKVIEANHACTVYTQTGSVFNVFCKIWREIINKLEIVEACCPLLSGINGPIYVMMRQCFHQRYWSFVWCCMWTEAWGSALKNYLFIFASCWSLSCSTGCTWSSFPFSFLCHFSGSLNVFHCFPWDILIREPLDMKCK